MFDVSVVIPTKNRSDDLHELLVAILNQTTLPKDVIVVDDSDDQKTRELIEQKREDFLRKNTLLKYLRGDKKHKSISVARNIGAKNASGDVICFIDDDTILDKDFVKEILRVYCTYGNVKGVQGYIINWRPYSTFSNALNRICFGFPRDYFEPNKCRAFPFSYPCPLTRVIESEWAIGANSSYKKEILNKFEYDESLIGYSFCEDIDISYRIQKFYPHSLFMTPYAKLVHKNSTVDRMSSRVFAYILVAYPTYLFYKNIKQTLTNNLLFYWGLLVGRFIQKLAVKNPNEIMFLAKATIEALRHFQEVKQGNLEFIYKKLNPKQPSANETHLGAQGK